MKNDVLFGICMGVGAIAGLLVGKRFLVYGVFIGIGVAALIIYMKKNKK